MPTKPSDFDILECYVESQRRKFIAASLITFGYRLFKTSTIIKRLVALKEFYSNPNKYLTGFSSEFADVLFDSLMDNIRISICFENYFKAKLLLNGFVIHNIDKKANQTLFKKQPDAPIEVNEIIPDVLPDDLVTLKKALKETTLNYSTLLSKESYCKFFNVGIPSLDFLKTLNSNRNRLHLFTSERISLSAKTLDMYHELNQLVDFDLAFLQNTLLNELDPESKSKIPFLMYGGR